ncbi:hypothetical protein C8F04DRAFT_1180358 [Mycena alexandri]|uniref:Uncharacterized protein n=1 Tax=Mycena alexandri TaxID=1745969 RepID=A0AAD6T1J3_9AGAR|nr:hypothetical protein C8F04DRAFT_1180358 [Mycena alexandri]
MTAESQWDTSYSVLSTAPLRERRFVIESTVELLELVYRQALGVLERGLGRNNQVELRRALYERTELYRRLHGLPGEYRPYGRASDLRATGSTQIEFWPAGQAKVTAGRPRLSLPLSRPEYNSDQIIKMNPVANNEPPSGRAEEDTSEEDYTGRGYGTDKTRREKALRFDSTGGRVPLEEGYLTEVSLGSGITAGSTTPGNQEPTVEEIPTVPLAALP